MVNVCFTGEPFGRLSAVPVNYELRDLIGDGSPVILVN